MPQPFRISHRPRPTLRSAIAASIFLAGPAAWAQMPPNSVTRPVDPDSSASSRVVVAVQPIGKVRYDGVTLPLTSPDGQFIVSQSGRTPSWETLLADRGQSVPIGMKLSVFRIELPAPPPEATPAKPDVSRPRTASLVPVEIAEPFPAGLLLGRAADDAGFLVEAPQPDGSRWIGRVRWLSSKVEWLVSDGRINAHAAIAPRGPGAASESRLAFVRRELNSRTFSLVVRSRSNSADAGVETQSVYTSPDRSQSFLFPFFSPDGRTLAAFAISTEDPVSAPLELVAFDLTRTDSDLRPCGRIDLGRAVNGLHSAYQCVAAMQTPATMPALPPGATSTPTRDLFARGLLFFSPRDEAMVWWQPQEHQLLNLASGSFAAVPFQHADFGFLLAGPGEVRAAKPGGSRTAAAQPPAGALTYQPLRIGSGPSLSEPSIGREVAVLASRALPRATSRADGVSILLAAPRSGDQDAFDVVLMAPAVSP